MKGLTPAIACGLMLSAGVYGLLAGAKRELPPPDDPWLTAWEEAGFRPEFQNVSHSPAGDLLFREGRALFRDPEPGGTVLRRYIFGITPANLVLLPSSESVPPFPYGRHLRFRLREGGESVHLLRAGRRMLLFPVTYSLSLWMRETTDLEMVGRAFDAFERTAEELP